MNKLTTSSFAGKNGLRTLKLAWRFSFLDLTTLNYEFTDEITHKRTSSLKKSTNDELLIDERKQCKMFDTIMKFSPLTL